MTLHIICMLCRDGSGCLYTCINCSLISPSKLTCIHTAHACMQAVKVMRECCSYEKRRVKSGVILFNIEVIRVGLRRRRAIRGVCMYGTEYTFLDGISVLFSSRQCDTRCSLWECAAIIIYPQQVTAFLDRVEESKKFPQLKNLSELTLTGKEEKTFLLMCRMKEDGSTEDKLLTLPADSHTMVIMQLMALLCSRLH